MASAVSAPRGLRLALSVIVLASLCLVLVASPAAPWLLLIVLVLAHAYPGRRCLHGHEIIDLGVPGWFKNHLQDVMWFKWELVFEHRLLHTGVLDLLDAALARGNGRDVVALAAGGGGPEPFLIEALRARENRDLRLLLTDYTPNPERHAKVAARFGPGWVEHRTDSVDLFALPDLPTGATLTLCGAAHHFLPHELARFLDGAIAKGQPVYVLDARASLRSVLLMPLRAFSFSVAAGLWYSVTQLDLRRLGTTLTLVGPLVQAYDAFISALRMYGAADVRALLAQVDGAQQYHWDLDGMDGLGDVSVWAGWPRETDEE